MRDAFLVLSLCVASMGWGLQGTGSAAKELSPLRPLPVSGMEVKLISESAPNPQMRFAKDGPERRLLPMECSVPIGLAPFRSLWAQYDLSLENEGKSYLVFSAWSGSNMWYQMGPRPLVTGRDQSVRIPIEGLRPAQFNDSTLEEGIPASFERVWVGLVLEGENSGSWWLRSAKLESAAYRAERPFDLPGLAIERWQVGKDPLVHFEMSKKTVDANGKEAVHFDFVFPRGKHMYVTPWLSFSPGQLVGYASFSLTYQASLPKGIEGLLIMLGERNGCQYYADPAPRECGEWRTVNIPFSAFRLGAWSRDPNERLDLSEVNKVYVACHGIATEEGQGTIRVREVLFLP